MTKFSDITEYLFQEKNKEKQDKAIGLSRSKFAGTAIHNKVEHPTTSSLLVLQHPYKEFDYDKKRENSRQ